MERGSRPNNSGRDDWAHFTIIALRLSRFAGQGSSNNDRSGPRPEPQPDVGRHPAWCPFGFRLRLGRQPRQQCRCQRRRIQEPGNRHDQMEVRQELFAQRYICGGPISLEQVKAETHDKRWNAVQLRVGAVRLR